MLISNPLVVKISFPTYIVYCTKYTYHISSAASVILVYSPSVCISKHVNKTELWKTGVINMYYFNKGILQHYATFQVLQLLEYISAAYYISFVLANISLMLYLNMTTDRVFLRMEIQYIFVGNHWKLCRIPF